MRRQQPRLAIALWLALLAWACGILTLSALSPDELPEPAFLFWDKVNHFAAYAIGGWLAAAAVRASRARIHPLWAAVSAVSLLAVFGVLDEALQTLTPGRSGADVHDWIADVLGAVAGALLNVLTFRPPQRLRRTP